MPRTIRNIVSSPVLAGAVGAFFVAQSFSTGGPEGGFCAQSALCARSSLPRNFRSADVYDGPCWLAGLLDCWFPSWLDLREDLSGAALQQLQRTNFGRSWN